MFRNPKIYFERFSKHYSERNICYDMQMMQML